MPFKDYRVTSEYGWRPNPFNTSQRQFHTGIDLVKGHQSPIYAFVGGEVIFASEGKTGSGFGGYGIVVAIKDKNNRLHVYAHLDSSVVKVGEKVNRGQMVGRQGNTGHSTGSHLHYEVRKNAQSNPPYGWIADRENNCFEPRKYVQDFWKAEEAEKAASNPSNGIPVLGQIKIGGTKTGRAIVCDKPSSTNSKDLAFVKDGQVLNIAGSVPGWWEVIWQGKRAYVNAKFGTLQRK